jgi:hypothetical protein
MAHQEVDQQIVNLKIGRDRAERMADDQDAPPDTFTIPWLTNSKLSRTHVPTDDDANVFDQKLLQSVVRAHTWVNALANGEYGSIEDLAKAVRIHPKVIRQNLRLAFLAPSITQAILEGLQTNRISLSTIPNKLPIRWSEQIDALGT